MQLIITHMCGPRDGEALLIEVAGSPPAVTFGRHSDCAVSLSDDPDISRRHARLVWRDGCWSLEDLGSTNGTFVGEFAKQQKITGPIGIEAGLVFRVGLSRFRVETTKSFEHAQSLRAERA
jgi:pSer/pThr/pTyr-binding forkhead associated (FHA) protein